MGRKSSGSGGAHSHIGREGHARLITEEEPETIHKQQAYTVAQGRLVGVPGDFGRPRSVLNTVVKKGVTSGMKLF